MGALEPVSGLSEWMAGVQACVEHALDEALPSADAAPSQLHQAMRYAVLQGGKRIRPQLAFAAGALTGAGAGSLARVAAAVEMIHAYSLVHDDLPCMDDDVLRRGKPTVHVQYGEATALLVGDALQSLAFELLARTDGSDRTNGVVGADHDIGIRLAMIGLLAQASGSRGMAGGQAIDLASIGQALDLAELETMHRAKTGALLRASVLLGAASGCVRGFAGRGTATPASGLGLSPELELALESYAQAIGLAFQVVDDVLDVETDTVTLGKTAGKDARQNKPTYVSILGLDESKRLAESLRVRAHDSLADLGEPAMRLRQLADYIVLRKY